MGVFLIEGKIFSSGLVYKIDQSLQIKAHVQMKDKDGNDFKFDFHEFSFCQL